MAKPLPKWLCGRALSAVELESIRREVRLADPPVRAEVARRVFYTGTVYDYSAVSLLLKP